ncbi:hypothetical protein C943_01387 [Mariniradius saccharolyticus AK6]|uniref:Uncharacterized protein n=1 Tax=Mariniradius saccharolyticus AK6 TaxID=1239962 RepID=M7X3Q6_9BACT|nr:hypothetical protein C943_01387 [Mariniradius saccharolyticus AK6]
MVKKKQKSLFTYFGKKHLKKNHEVIQKVLGALPRKKSLPTLTILCKFDTTT